MPLFDLLGRAAGGSRRSIIAAGLVLPILGSLALCAVASAWPVRLDYRAMQDLLRFRNLDLPQSGGKFTVFTGNNAIESARIVTFGLRQLAFPDGSIRWIVLKEQCAGPWWGGFAAVDTAGTFFVPTASAKDQLDLHPTASLNATDQQDVLQSTVVYDSDSTRVAIEQRLPFVKAAPKIAVLSQGSPTSAFSVRRPASEFTLERTTRITAVLGSFFAIVLTLLQLPPLRATQRSLIWASGAFLSVGVNLSLSYLLQWIPLMSVQRAPLLVWVILLAVALLLAASREYKLSVAPPGPSRPPVHRAFKAYLVYAGLAYALLFLVRLDFDGDFFNNWLPQGRFHYLLGRHDPVAIMTQGSMQAASYPPGYGILLSQLMWMSGMNPHASFLLDPETSFAILIYRLFIFGLNLAFLILVSVYLEKLGSSRSETWPAAVLIIALLIPSVAGKHIASETLLFPMLGAAIVMIATGRRSNKAALTIIGLSIGGMAALIKWEATLLFAVAALPWLASDLARPSERPSRNAKLRWLLVLAVSLLPVLIWKYTLTVPNEFFAPVTLSRLHAALPGLPGLAIRAVRLLFEDGRLLLLVFALPAAVLWRLRRQPSWRPAAVPVSIVLLFVGWVAVFLFTNMDPHFHLETSYSRLVMAPTFSAILYCAETLQIHYAEEGSALAYT